MPAPSFGGSAAFLPIVEAKTDAAVAVAVTDNGNFIFI